MRASTSGNRATGDVPSRVREAGAPPFSHPDCDRRLPARASTVAACAAPGRGLAGYELVEPAHRPPVGNFTQPRRRGVFVLSDEDTPCRGTFGQGRSSRTQMARRLVLAVLCAGLRLRVRSPCSQSRCRAACSPAAASTAADPCGDGRRPTSGDRASQRSAGRAAIGRRVAVEGILVRSQSTRRLSGSAAGSGMMAPPASIGACTRASAGCSCCIAAGRRPSIRLSSCSPSGQIGTHDGDALLAEAIGLRRARRRPSLEPRRGPIDLTPWFGGWAGSLRSSLSVAVFGASA